MTSSFWFRGLEAAQQLGQAVDQRDGAEPLAVVDGGIAADDLAGLDVAGDSRLRGGDGSVAYGAVAGDADLSGEDDAAADGGRSGEADLGTEQGVAADGGAVAYLDEIVDLGPGVDAGFADAGAVDAGVGLDFDVVFEDGGAGLLDLVPASAGLDACLFGEAEAVGSDDGSVLEDDVVAEAAVLADDGVGVGEEVVAGADVGIEDDVGQKGGVVADDDVLADDDVGADVGVRPDLCGGSDGGGAVDAGSVGGRLVEELDGAGEGEVGILDAQGGGGDLGEVRFDEDGGGLGGAGEGGVLGVGDEGEVAGSGGVDGGDAGDVLRWGRRGGWLRDVSLDRPASWFGLYRAEGEPTGKDEMQDLSLRLGRMLGGRGALKSSFCRLGAVGAGRGFLREGVVMTAMSWRSAMAARGT